MTPSSAPVRAVPVRDLSSPPTPPPAGAFLSGVLALQIANNALHLAQPLLIAELSGSLAIAAAVSAGDTALHMLGTFLTGPAADRLGSRRVLILTTLGRAAALAVIPLAAALGRLTLPVALAAYALDAIVRGGIDTAAHALPQELALDAAGLDRLNARYELAFDLGAVVGPLLLGLSLVARSSAAHAVIPLGFAGAALLFWLIPQAKADRAAPVKAARVDPWEAVRLLRADRKLAWGCAALAALNLYPLRKLVSAFFAKAILHQKAAAGWIGAAFGLGGVAGSLLYARYGRRLPPKVWLGLGAAGSVLLGVGVLPGSLAAVAAAAFFFSLLNVGARLSLTTSVQAATPRAAAGRVAALWRSASNLVSVALKAAAGAVFAAKAGAGPAFAVLAAGLAALALLQAALGARFVKKG
jgi:predicted MFS family arabinose efflux permease